MECKSVIFKLSAAAPKRAYQWGNHIFNKRLHDAIKRGADYHTDCQIHHIAAQDKFLKLLEHSSLIKADFLGRANLD